MVTLQYRNTLYAWQTTDGDKGQDKQPTTGLKIGRRGLQLRPTQTVFRFYVPELLGSLTPLERASAEGHNNLVCKTEHT